MKKELIKFFSLLNRNIKLYFSDKTIFFTSLLAPMILLLLFVLFLKGVYVDSLESLLPENLVIAAKVKESFVASWLMSSLMSVTCVTVSIGACLIMVQDKINGVINDIRSTPIKNGVVSISYLVATFVSAMIIMLTILSLGFIYIAVCGWYMSAFDVLRIIACTVLLTLFGCGLAVVINSFIKSEGGITAVSALTSSIYGFICGAYMPLSQFGKTFSNIFGFNPGLYGATLFKKLFLRGAMSEMSKTLPIEAVNGIMDGFDINFYFFNKNVPEFAMWCVLSLAVVLLLIIAIMIANRKTIKKKSIIKKSPQA